MAGGRQQREGGCSFGKQERYSERVAEEVNAQGTALKTNTKARGTLPTIASGVGQTGFDTRRKPVAFLRERVVRVHGAKWTSPCAWLDRGLMDKPGELQEKGAQGRYLPQLFPLLNNSPGSP